MNIKIKNLNLRGLIVGTSVLFVTWSIKAQPLAFDEFGNSNYQPGQQMADPTGGVPDGNVLVYNLPFAGVSGDLIIREGNLNGPIEDYIRFDGNSQLIFYASSANTLAYVPFPPSPLLPNLAYAVDVGGYADYSPSSGQPGFDSSNPAYHFITEVPEPGTGVLVALGAGLMLVMRRRLQR
jgi:hypothetical protein